MLVLKTATDISKKGTSTRTPSEEPFNCHVVFQGKGFATGSEDPCFIGVRSCQPVSKHGRAAVCTSRQSGASPEAAMDVKLLMQPGITQNSLTATLQCLGEEKCSVIGLSCGRRCSWLGWLGLSHHAETAEMCIVISTQACDLH